MDKFGYHPSANLQLFIEDLAALLPACLCNFQNLSALSISFPDDPRPLCTELVNNIFRYVPLSSLKELHLALPPTYDFATLLMQETINSSTPSRSSIKSTMKQLKYLSVSISDGSGFGGERYYQRPPSSAQRAFPNEEYSDQFFELIQLAEELESLRISCTHVLNMDALDATHLCKLRSLELQRVKIFIRCSYQSWSGTTKHFVPYSFGRLSSRVGRGQMCLSNYAFIHNWKFSIWTLVATQEMESHLGGLPGCYHLLMIPKISRPCTCPILSLWAISNDRSLPIVM